MVHRQENSSEVNRARVARRLLRKKRIKEFLETIWIILIALLFVGSIVLLVLWAVSIQEGKWRWE